MTPTEENDVSVTMLILQSSSPSHSLTANYQQVLASMKSHTALCAVVSDGEKKQLSKIKSGFKSLLTSLEEELGQLTLYVKSCSFHLNLQSKGVILLLIKIVHSCTGQ